MSCKNKVLIVLLLTLEKYRMRARCEEILVTELLTLKTLLKETLVKGPVFYYILNMVNFYSLIIVLDISVQGLLI